MSHDHPRHTGAVSRKLVIASIATAVFVAVEIVMGVRANSLALVGDALHNVTDTLALLLALFAVRLERRPATSAKSYGWHRAGVLAAFINSGTLAAFTIFLFVEAAQLDEWSAWRLVRSFFVFHLLRWYPAWAGWLPRHAPRLKPLLPDETPEAHGGGATQTDTA